MKKAIAMKCDKEQFKAIKPMLKKLGCEINYLEKFYNCPYLVNNLDGDGILVSNVFPKKKSEFGREVHETWNEKVFLEACGVEVVPTLEEVKEYFKDAEIVCCAYSTSTGFNLNDYDFSSLVYGEKISSELKRDVLIFKKADPTNYKFLFDSKKGYAKILTYKDPIEETFTITKSQILSLYGYLIDKKADFPEWFPTAFEPEKKELVVELGKWYKTDYCGGSLFCVTDISKIKEDLVSGYGKEQDYGWQVSRKDYWCLKGVEEATRQEVEEAIGNEIKRRYKVGDYVKSLYHKNNPVIKIVKIDPVLARPNSFHVTGSSSAMMPVLFDNGIFAEIIHPKKMTQAEIETELGYNIEIV